MKAIHGIFLKKRNLDKLHEQLLQEYTLALNYMEECGLKKGFGGEEADLLREVYHQIKADRERLEELSPTRHDLTPQMQTYKRALKFLE